MSYFLHHTPNIPGFDDGSNVIQPESFPNFVNETDPSNNHDTHQPQPIPEYCQVLKFKDANGHVKEMVFPKALDLDRPKRPRTTFTPEQLSVLEECFLRNQYLVGKERCKLATTLGLSETQVKVWFQNRRTKCKRDRVDSQPSFANLSHTGSNTSSGNEASPTHRQHSGDSDSDKSEGTGCLNLTQKSFRSDSGAIGGDVIAAKFMQKGAKTFGGNAQFDFPNKSDQDDEDDDFDLAGLDDFAEEAPNAPSIYSCPPVLVNSWNPTLTGATFPTGEGFEKYATNTDHYSNVQGSFKLQSQLSAQQQLQRQHQQQPQRQPAQEELFLKLQQKQFGQQYQQYSFLQLQQTPQLGNCFGYPSHP